MKEIRTIGIMTDEEAESQQVYDSKVNHPSHYNDEGGMECIDQMVLLFGKPAVADFCRCNIFKYRYRYNSTRNQTDLDKAEWYARYLEGIVSEPQDMFGGMIHG